MKLKCFRHDIKLHCEALKVKGKLVPVLLSEHGAIRAYWGSGGIAPLIFDLGTKWR
jgi:hypothetical protein